jgi:hypothetical protein
MSSGYGARVGLSSRALAMLAFLAAAWCLVLAPIQSAVSAEAYQGPKPLIVMVMAPLVELAAAIHAAVGRGFGSPYEFWGRLFPPVYLGVAAGLAVVRRGAGSSIAARRAAALAIAAACVGAITDAGAYWSYGTPLQPILWSGGFAVELLAIAVLLLGLLWLAITLVRAGRHLEGAILLAGPALVVPGMIVVRYAPHGVLLPVVIAVAIAAATAASRPAVRPRSRPGSAPSA